MENVNVKIPDFAVCASSRLRREVCVVNSLSPEEIVKRANKNNPAWQNHYPWILTKKQIPCPEFPETHHHCLLVTKLLSANVIDDLFGDATLPDFRIFIDKSDSCTVCAINALTPEEITARVNKQNPVGLVLSWVLAKDNFWLSNQCKCLPTSQQTHKHYHFVY